MERAFNIIPVLFLTVLSVSAEMRLGSPFSCGAVLQRDRPVPVWGWTSPGETVTVRFADQVKSAQATDSGKWSVVLDSMQASFEGRNMTVSTAAERISIDDILVGEVWFASGQSNMECPIKGPSPRFRDGQGRLAIAMTREPNVRFFKVKKAWDVEPLETTPYGWYRFTAEDIAKINDRPSLSAVAFYYALDIFHGAKVPVGIIEASVGGTNIDAWTPRSGLLSRTDLKDVADYQIKKDWVGARDAKGAINGGSQQPTVLWNAMVAPFVPYAIRGLIWYQGCHNASEAQRYCSKMHALYQGWSKEFLNPDLALYFVELAPYNVSWFDIQQAQHRFAEEEKNAAIAISCDVGNPNDVHHNEKRTVAHRLAVHALKRLYGFSSVEDESPRPKAATLKGEIVTLTFDHAQKIYFYNIPRTRPEGFELAGPDGLWHPAEVVNAEAGKTRAGGIYYPGLLKGGARHLELLSATVPHPVKLRYLHEKPWTGCVYNESDLPLGSFQMDISQVDVQEVK